MKGSKEAVKGARQALIGLTGASWHGASRHRKRLENPERAMKELERHCKGLGRTAKRRMEPVLEPKERSSFSAPE